MIVVGLNAYHGDVSAALVRDGRLIAAIEEERFRRIKHCAGFPHRAIAECERLVERRSGEKTRRLVDRQHVGQRAPAFRRLQAVTRIAHDMPLADEELEVGANRGNVPSN